MKSASSRAEEKFDERANEDAYFAAKEHDLIDEMKTEFRNIEAARGEARMMICPKCSGTFGEYRFMGFSLDRCASCEGIWLKKGELEGILRQQARGPLGVFLDRCFAKDKSKTKHRSGWTV